MKSTIFILFSCSGLINVDLHGTKVLHSMHDWSNYDLNSHNDPEDWFHTHNQLLWIGQPPMIDLQAKNAVKLGVSYQETGDAATIYDDQLSRRSEEPYYSLQGKVNNFGEKWTTRSYNAYRSAKHGADHVIRTLAETDDNLLRPIFRPVGKLLQFFMSPLGTSYKGNRNVRSNRRRYHSISRSPWSSSTLPAIPEFSPLLPKSMTDDYDEAKHYARDNEGHHDDDDKYPEWKHEQDRFHEPNDLELDYRSGKETHIAGGRSLGGVEEHKKSQNGSVEVKQEEPVTSKEATPTHDNENSTDEESHINDYLGAPTKHSNSLHKKRGRKSHPCKESSEQSHKRRRRPHKRGRRSNRRNVSQEHTAPEKLTNALDKEEDETNSEEGNFVPSKTQTDELHKKETILRSSEEKSDTPTDETIEKNEHEPLSSGIRSASPINELDQLEDAELQDEEQPIKNPSDKSDKTNEEFAARTDLLNKEKENQPRDQTVPPTNTNDTTYEKPQNSEEHSVERPKEELHNNENLVLDFHADVSGEKENKLQSEEPSYENDVETSSDELGEKNEDETAGSVVKSKKDDPQPDEQLEQFNKSKPTDVVDKSEDKQLHSQEENLKPTKKETNTSKENEIQNHNTEHPLKVEPAEVDEGKLAEKNEPDNRQEESHDPATNKGEKSSSGEQSIPTKNVAESNSIETRSSPTTNVSNSENPVRNSGKEEEKNQPITTKEIVPLPYEKLSDKISHNIEKLALPGINKSSEVDSTPLSEKSSPDGQERVVLPPKPDVLEKPKMDEPRNSKLAIPPLKKPSSTDLKSATIAEISEEEEKDPPHNSEDVVSTPNKNKRISQSPHKPSNMSPKKKIKSSHRRSFENHPTVALPSKKKTKKSRASRVRRRPSKKPTRRYARTPRRHESSEEPGSDEEILTRNRKATHALHRNGRNAHNIRRQSSPSKRITNKKRGRRAPSDEDYSTEYQDPRSAFHKRKGWKARSNEDYIERYQKPTRNTGWKARSNEDNTEQNQKPPKLHKKNPKKGMNVRLNLQIGNHYRNVLGAV